VELRESDASLGKQTQKKETLHQGDREEPEDNGGERGNLPFKKGGDEREKQFRQV